MEEFRAYYEYRREGNSRRHMWAIVGATAGMHLHISEYDKIDGVAERPCGGLEIHYRTPPEYRANEPPDHDKCFLLKQPCWHDGSSMAATEFWIPYWQSEPHDHDRMFKMLGMDLKKRLETP